MQPTENPHIIRAQLDTLKKLRGDLDLEIERLERKLNPASDPRNLPADGTFMAEVATAIYEALLQERPLHRTTILERIDAAGIYVGGKDRMRSLSAYLSQDPRFVSEGRGYWTFANPPADADKLRREDNTDPWIAENDDIASNPDGLFGSPQWSEQVSNQTDPAV